MVFPVKTPSVIQNLSSNYTWRINDSKKLYLTFDDGPVPEITPWVLDTLNLFKVKATFFCVGENAKTNPDILQRILAEGHQVGNHTHNHLKGWNTTAYTYLKNTLEAQQYLPSTNLFRPPYGKIKPQQAKAIVKRYRMCMWSILTGDYSQKISPEMCLKNALKASEGDIILFHDNVKALANISYALPRFLEYYLSKGYEFDVLRA